MGADGQWGEIVDYYRARARDDPRRCFDSLKFQHSYTRSVSLLAVLETIGDEIMARGKKDSPSKGDGTKAQWKGFVNIRVGEDAEQAIDEFLSDSDFIFDSFVGLLESGHKVSFTYDRRNDATICAITGEYADCPNAGYTLTTFAGSWYDALRVALYKHLILAKTKWDTAASENSRPRFG